MMIIDKLNEAKRAIKNLEHAKLLVEHWESEVAEVTDELAVMNKPVTFDGETTTVGELVDKINAAQVSVNYMTYEIDDRMSRSEQRKAQDKLDAVIALAEKAILEKVE